MNRSWSKSLLLGLAVASSMHSPAVAGENVQIAVAAGLVGAAAGYGMSGGFNHALTTLAPIMQQHPQETLLLSLFGTVGTVLSVAFIADMNKENTRLKTDAEFVESQATIKELRNSNAALLSQLKKTSHKDAV